MAKADIKICPYVKCPFPDHEVDISVHPYVRAKNGRYYHQQCFDEEQKAKQRTAEEKADIALFLDLWNKHISNTVNYGVLRKMLNEYIMRGVSTDYLVFCLQYIVANRCILNYPNGFKYYVDRREIKDAYEKKQMQKQAKAIDEQLKKQSSQPIGSDSNAPHFAVQKQQSQGFERILNK